MIPDSVSSASHLECPRCSDRADLHTLQSLCPCGGTWLTRYDLSRAGASASLQASHARGLGLWNWAEVLPVQEAGNRRGLGEGGTPLRPEPALARKLGVEHVLLKDEGQNPGGSFKARGMAVAVARAKELGVDRVHLPTAGNAGVAASAYGAAWSLEVTVAFPEGTPEGYIRDAAHHGASCHRVPGSIADAGAWLRERFAEEPAVSLATLREPYRVEGKKTMGYELVAQGGGRWPSVVIYPTGGGTGIIGMWKAHREMEELGWVDGEPPRFVVVQSDGCAPLVRAFEEGRNEARPWESPETFASGLRVPGSVGDHLILEAVHESGGTAVSVSEEDIERAVEYMARSTGVLPASEAAATWAAAERLKAEGWLRPEDSVCLFITGSGVVGSGARFRGEA